MTVDAGNTDCTFTIGIISDDFTNVGAAENTQGTIFRATGTTPTSWTSESVLTDQGDPIATVMENTFDGTPVWTRADVGTYTCTLADAFTEGKTFILLNGQAVAPEQELLGFALAYWGDINSLQMVTTNAAGDTAADNLLFSVVTFIQIIVYP